MTTELTTEELDALEALLAKATPGPCDVFSNNGIDWMVSTLSIPQHPIALLSMMLPFWQGASSFDLKKFLVAHPNLARHWTEEKT